MRPALTRGAVQARLEEAANILGAVRHDLQALGRQVGGEVEEAASDLRQVEWRLNGLLARFDDAVFNPIPQGYP